MSIFNKVIKNCTSLFVKNRLWNLTNDPEYDYEARFPCRLTLIDNLLLRKAYGNIMEVGCGNGRFLIKLKEMQNMSSIVGVDISMEMTRQAHFRGLRVIRAHGERLPFKKEVFDVVMSANGSPKEMNWKELFSEVHRVLRRNSFFVFDTYNKYPLEKIVKYKLMSFLGLSEKHFSGITGGIDNIKDFQKTCSRLGFKIIALYTLFPLPFAPYGILLRGPFTISLNTHFIGILKKL